MLGGLCLPSLIPVITFELIAYPLEDCRFLSVDPDSVKMLELPAETEVAICMVSSSSNH